MTKIAIPAYSLANKFIKSEWKGVMLLALKTTLLLALFELLASIPFIIISVTEITLKVENVLVHVAILQVLTAIIVFFLTQWLISPLFIAISRSVILGEPFDRVLCKRLTNTRTVRVMKLLWSLMIILIPYYILVVIVGSDPEMFIKIISLRLELIVAIATALFVYLFIVAYICMRIYYLVPALATDRPFSSVQELWKHSKGHAWSVFKVLLLGILLFLGVALVFGLGIFFLLGLLAGKLAIKILVGIVIFVLLLVALVLLVLLIPQYAMAAVAGVYKLSKAKGDKA